MLYWQQLFQFGGDGEVRSRASCACDVDEAAWLGLLQCSIWRLIRGGRVVLHLLPVRHVSMCQEARLAHVGGLQDTLGNIRVNRLKRHL